MLMFLMVSRTSTFFLVTHFSIYIACIRQRKPWSDTVRILPSNIMDAGADIPCFALVLFIFHLVCLARQNINIVDARQWVAHLMAINNVLGRPLARMTVLNFRNETSY